MEHIQAVLDRAHVAIDRANALTSEVQTLQLAADRQQLRARDALREASDLQAAGATLNMHSQSVRPGSSAGQPAADRAEASLRSAAAASEAATQSTETAIVSRIPLDSQNAERSASGSFQRDVLTDAHAAIAAARNSPSSPPQLEYSGVAAITQQRADSVAALASLRRRQLRLRACQMRALRCLLAAEPQLAGFSVLDGTMRQAGALLSTALVHVELAERVLEGWTATEALPAIVMRADDRAEAAAAMARDLLHNLHTELAGGTADGSRGPALQPQPKLLGASAAQIERLQCDTVDAADVELLAESCSICLSDFAVGDRLRCMPCSHIHHRDCLDEWLAIKASCPLCQQQLAFEG